MFGFPELTNSFLSGQDLFYQQFNNVNFYVEDTEQENLYYQILKKLFPNMNFDKIFPLNGKDNVQNAARENITCKDKVYIIDLDFDDILGKKLYLKNLFYLEKYSIENYLCNKESVWELIREKNPKLKDSDINAIVDFNILKSQWKPAFEKLNALFLIINKYSLPDSYYGIECNRDYLIENDELSLKGSFISTYYKSVENSFINTHSSLDFRTAFRDSICNFNSLEKIIVATPGKYILNLLKHQLRKQKLIDECELESFTYKLSKASSFESLFPIRDKIVVFINS